MSTPYIVHTAKQIVNARVLRASIRPGNLSLDIVIMLFHLKDKFYDRRHIYVVSESSDFNHVRPSLRSPRQVSSLLADITNGSV